MEANDLEPQEIIPASRKLGADDARQLVANADRVIVAKGKKVTAFEIHSGKPTDDVVAAMLGPTGNLRAPTIQTGKTVLVGFNDEQYGEVLTN
mgnify:CR=1 FL=1